MRWPLRYQIVLPMAAIMLLTVIVVGGAGALLAIRGTKAHIDAQIREVARIVEDSNFPLTTPVLRQMNALSGAELIAVDENEHAVSASGRLFNVSSLPPQATSSGSRGNAWSQRVQLRDRMYFHTVVAVPPERGGKAVRLHILYPENEYRRAWQQAVYPSLGFIAVALPIVLLLALATGSRIAGRVGRLREQVDRIAQGEFEQFAVPAGDDEIRALAQAVNRMSSLLANYEQEIRRTERMRTLAHLSGGVAHQLRNSATGCAMAVDLHADECPLGQSSESLSVAKRQLRLMEEYVQRLLRLGKADDSPVDRPVDLVALVDDLLPLVRPAARHAGVELQWDRGESIGTVAGDTERLGQAVINLLLNAIEAASQSVGALSSPSRVQITLSQSTSNSVMLVVSDSGLGPAEPVKGSVFEPFVSEKPDGVGLGLSVARQIVDEHGGRIHWRRTDGMTCFTIELPCESTERKRVETVGCR